ncbi:hypothetical protein GGE68_003328 [Rhizobium leguminosarum]|uniref:hypothetical protein n=1 Tax=Rhizobium leguminosarum TaxID=384 RepID=UPI00160D273E|nr:hypothetical protein [Rhizobium leguminosarum]MBB5665114.1 hypothetical protein [Rhizobium leguminosarum]
MARPGVANKTNSLNEYLDVLTKIIAIGSVVLVAIQSIFDFSLFANRTGGLSDRYNREVLPLVVVGDAGTPEMNASIEADDKAGFEVAVRKLVVEKALYGQVVSAVEATESLINCHESFFCRVDDYADYEQSLRRFWYTYRVVVQSERGNLLPPSFGALVEKEARRILESDRERGFLPK